MASQPSRQIKTIVAANVQAARLSQGLTQSQLAAQIGVESMAVSRWERGQVRPSDSNLQALASVLGHDPSWFFVDRNKKAAA
jgi:transcriptional regulator with XRE-family HTH domain